MFHFRIAWYSSSSNGFYETIGVPMILFLSRYICLIHMCVRVCSFTMIAFIRWWGARPISQSDHRAASSLSVFLLLMLFSLWEYQLFRWSLRLFAYYPFGHYKPLIISVFVRGYWYLLTLKLTETLTHTSNDAETIQRYLLLSHSIFVFNYPFSNGIHQMCSSVFWTLLLRLPLLFSAFPNVERYNAHKRCLGTGNALTNGKRNPGSILSLVSL